MLGVLIVLHLNNAICHHLHEVLEPFIKFYNILWMFVDLYCWFWLDIRFLVVVACAAQVHVHLELGFNLSMLFWLSLPLSIEQPHCSLFEVSEWFMKEATHTHRRSECIELGPLHKWTMCCHWFCVCTISCNDQVRYMSFLNSSYWHKSDT